MGPLFQLLGATLFQAMIINVIFRLAAKHEADTDFSKSAMVAAAIVTTSWVMGQMLVDRMHPGLGLLLIAAVIAVLAAFLFAKFCWLSIRSAILVTVIFMVVNGAIIGGLTVLYLRAWHPSSSDKVQTTTKAEVQKKPRKKLPPELQKLADLQAWQTARVPLHEQLGGLFKALRNSDPVLKSNSLRANLRTQWNIGGMSRCLEMEINGEAKGPEAKGSVDKLIYTLKERAPFKDTMETARLGSSRSVVRPGDVQETLIFQVACRYKQTPLGSFEERLTSEEATIRVQAEIKKHLPPAESPLSWSEGQVEQASAAANVSIRQVRPEKVLVLSNATFVPYRIRIVTRDDHDGVVRLIRQLESNPYCTVTFVKIDVEPGKKPYTVLLCEWPMIQ